MNCTAALPPPRNGTIIDHSVPAIPGTQVTFHCKDELFPEGIMTSTCLVTGEWDKNPEEIVCRIEPSKYNFSSLLMSMFPPSCVSSSVFPAFPSTQWITQHQLSEHSPN